MPVIAVFFVTTQETSRSMTLQFLFFIKVTIERLLFSVTEQSKAASATVPVSRIVPVVYRSVV